MSRWSPRSRPAAAPLLIAAVALTFAASLSSGFVYDDLLLIVNNDQAHSLDQALGAFGRHFFERGAELDAAAGQYHYYRPLVALSYVLNWVSFDGAAWGFHLTNLLLHLLNTWLGYRALVRWTDSRRVALFAGLVFGLHPTRAAVVVWVSGRPDLMMTTFLLLGCEAYARYLDRRRWGWAAAALVAMGAGMLSKELAVLGPLLLAVELWAARRRASLGRPPSSPDITARAPHRRAFGERWRGDTACLAWIGGGGLLSLTYLVSRAVWLPLGPSGDWLPLLALMTVGGYAARVVWPWPPGFHHFLVEVENGAVVPDVSLLLFGALTLVVIGVSAYRLRRNPVGCLLGLTALAFLAPVSNLRATGFGTVFDRFLYLPLLPLSAVALGGVARWRPSRRAGTALLGVALGWAGVNLVRIPDFASDQAFWERERELEPQNVRALLWLANGHLRRAETASAMELLEQAIRPDLQHYFGLYDSGDRMKAYARLVSVLPAEVPDGDERGLRAILEQIRHLLGEGRPAPAGRVHGVRLGLIVSSEQRALLRGLYPELRLAGALVASRLGVRSDAQRWLDQIDDEGVAQLSSPSNFVLVCARTGQLARARRLLASPQLARTREALAGRLQRAARLRPAATVGSPGRELGLARMHAELGAYGQGLRVLGPLLGGPLETLAVRQLYVQLLVAARRYDDAVARASRSLPPGDARAVVAAIERQLPGRLRALPRVP